MNFFSPDKYKFVQTDYKFPSYHSESIYLNKQSITERTPKYIPKQFRDKHFPEQKFKQPYTNNDYKRRMSVVKNPFQKQQRKNIIASSGQLVPSTNNKWNAIKQDNKTEKKKITLNLHDIEIPKLRQTKSTQCQSPKANYPHSKIQQFLRIKLLGKGKFGDVYLVKHIKTGFIAALKIINKLDLLRNNRQENEKSVNQLLRQIKIQSYMQHPNLIQLYDFFSDQINVYLLLQLACDGHLYDFLIKKLFFTEQTTSILSREIIAGVNYMHTHNIIHRDIKLQNIVLSHGLAKICDFGWSVHSNNDFRSTLCGTPIYLSPQILTGKSYNKKIDIWAVGALVHQLFTSQNPFNVKTQSDLSKIVTQDFEMQVGSPQIRNFLTFILRKNPAKRPDAQTLIKHPFIQKYRDLQTSQELCRLVYANKKKK